MADEKSLKTLTTVVYALQAAGFLVGITWIVAVVIDYVKRDEAKGLVLVGWFILAADTVWIVYRIVKGWLYLNEGKPIT
jgi:uncharacterized membrane protein